MRVAPVAVVCVLCLCIAVVVQASKIKTRAEADPAFDFAAVHTWDWDADAGDVLMARTATDDPAPVKRRVDPLIRKYVAGEMAARGLVSATGTPDLRFRYYVLVTVGSTDQSVGQFLPAVSYWGLPPFAPATTALSVVTQGSLVLDAMRPSDRRVVWRGIAQTAVEDTDSDAKRDARIRDAVRELVKRIPSKKK